MVRGSAAASPGKGPVTQNWAAPITAVLTTSQRLGAELPMRVHSYAIDDSSNRAGRPSAYGSLSRAPVRALLSACIVVRRCQHRTLVNGGTGRRLLPNTTAWVLNGLGDLPTAARGR